MTHPRAILSTVPRTLLAVAAVLAGLTACADNDGKTGSGESAKLTVFAASSLTQTFGILEKSLESEQPGVDVVISFDSSTTLAEQISQGAPADVIATADEESMQVVANADQLAADPVHFASNTLVVVTQAGNPADLSGLADLQTADFVVCDPSAPCGAASAQILQSAQITAPARSLEPNVAAVLSKVTLGEADAGLVYVTDAKAAGDQVETFNIPSDVNVVNPYYIAPVEGSPEPDLAQEWIALVQSQAGQKVLHNAGFDRP